MSELAPGSPWKAMVLPALLPARPLAISIAPPTRDAKDRKTLQNLRLATFRRANAAARMEYY
jgi:hypothetical protein